MHWKQRYKSFYYQNADIGDLDITVQTSALLIVDLQNEFLMRGEHFSQTELARWREYLERMDTVVIPNNKKLLSLFRNKKLECIFARIGSHKKDGSDRSLVQRKPGFNNLLLPKGEYGAQIINELPVQDDEIVVIKTTDSAITGTNLCLMLRNLGITDIVVTGVFTDQCVSSTVRSLADESFNVILVEDATAAATLELHENELYSLNNIYCQVLNTQEIVKLFS